jgi:UPF0042 nucleotide-binding protein
VSAAAPRIVIVSGVSGGGKTTAMAALEDLDFYCIDNLPAQLIEPFLGLCADATPPIEKIALAIDTRELTFLQPIPAVLRQLRERGAAVKVIFLECASEVLVNRYRETRRVHPHARDGVVAEGIEAERRLLVDVARLADHTIDTSTLNVHRLKADIVRLVSDEPRSTVVNLTSFGFRYGTPQAAELLFDVRFLPNPQFVSHLRDRTGHDPEVAEYVLKSAEGSELVTRLCELLAFLLPLYDAEGKVYLTIGVGCTGGRHRSVAVTEALADELRGSGREINIDHRDVGRA